MSKMKKVSGFKKYLHLASCLGAAVVIIGALFKIMHWPGASIALIGGLGTEALLFACSLSIFRMKRLIGL